MTESKPMNNTSNRQSESATVSALLASLLGCIDALRKASQHDFFSSEFSSSLSNIDLSDETTSIIRLILLFLQVDSTTAYERGEMEHGARKLMRLIADDRLEKDELRYLLARSIEATLEGSDEADRLAQSSLRVREQADLLLRKFKAISENGLSLDHGFRIGDL